MKALLKELADRCEAAIGPDRELDVAIFKGIGAPVPFQFANQLAALVYDEAEQCYFAPVGDLKLRYEPPAFTASLDAAMTLADDKEAFAKRVPSNGPPCRACVWNENRNVGFDADAATMPLALCAAALRARAMKP